MSPDEISELAEFVWLCCAEAERDGKPILVRPDGLHLENCPLLTAFGSYETILLEQHERGGFFRGFDGDPTSELCDPRLFDLGRRFREQALSGEGFR